MLKKLLTGLILVGWISASAYADPIVITATPTPLDASVGDQVLVDVSISTDQLIGGYDITLGFDDSILSFVDVVFGSSLNGGVDLFSLAGGTLGIAGVDVFEISLLAELELSFFQDLLPDSFSLFSVVFETIGPGISPFNPDVINLADSAGAPIFGVSTVSGSVTVGNVVAVPEPGTLGLFGIGLFAIAWLRRRSIC